MINFPSPPLDPGYIHTAGNRSWEWNGANWDAVNGGATGLQGTQGIQGRQGIQGTQGTQGLQGTTGSFGGAAFDYLFNTATSDANPGSGKTALNTSDATLATAMYISYTDSLAVSIYNFLQTVDDSTSSIKGHFTITQKTDHDNYGLFAITGFHSEHVDHFDVPVSFVSGTPSFTNNMEVIVTFARTGDKGDTGSQGTQGIQGIQGVQGTQGTQGIQGIQGAQGTQGIIGSTGAQGITGTQGIQGIQGVQGTQGIQGRQGIQGTLGTQGTQGLQGIQGIQGTVGSQGTTGSQGAVGAQGTQGIQGIQGRQGITGANGANGSNGSNGAQGAQGTVGSTGSTGSNGGTGAQGAQGAAGATGATGGTGGTGATGAQGTSGATIDNTERTLLKLNFTGVGGNSGAVFGESHYQMGQASGSWSHPYPDLIIGYHTGIRIGAYLSYGGTRFYNNSPTSNGGTEAELMSIGNGDNHVRVANNLYVSTNGSTGGGIILADDGDIVDLNDGYCAMRFSYGVRIHGGNRTGGAVIRLHSNGTIVANSTITAYGDASDIRLKENVVRIDNALDKVMKMNGYYFNYIGKPDRMIGVIAQEVEPILKEVVYEYENIETEEKNKAVHYGNITALLIEAIKELKAEVAELKSKL
jgi:hypothetical protein